MDAGLVLRFPLLFSLPPAGRWLTIQFDLGLAPATIDAYGRALVDYLRFSQQHTFVVETATREHIAAYVHHLANQPAVRPTPDRTAGLANATMQQRLVAVRLFYDFLVEEGLRTQDNPVRRGIYTPHKGFGGSRERGLIPHYQKLPWIPSDEEWSALLTVLKQEPIRNRLMFALSYDAALRREEICTLQTGDVDPTRRLITLRAEATKGRRSRVVPYSPATGQLYMAYLHQRQRLSRQRGPLFLSESRRNRSQPISIWTWAKAIRTIARRAGLPRFTSHTLRHLCLTDLARAGWDIHEIALFAGHRHTDTTLIYIHLSGRDLADRLAKSMNSVHAWRIALLEGLASVN
ncbi:tyrosine-type recombinase/integrase [Spirosoma sp. 209]|uniref:tyrosine-type recombinase/integrase n=1 Tax=Spirosoma sp. 209 TaxID=1955701 RepID=UPI00098CFEFE|nr:tyrosine-type recombinase/integrase [Spirosoma sp. 209]